MIRKNIITILVSIAIFWLSMANSSSFNNVSLIDLPYTDKIVHAGMYFALMFAILFENRKRLVNTSQILKASLFPLSYGILIELLQSLTASRSASFYDALADSGGILLSIILWKFVRPARVSTK